MRPTPGLLVAGLMLACGGSQSLEPVEPSQQGEIAARCTALFPQLPWRVTHVVDAKLPMGEQGSFLGVVAADAPHQFRTILVSLEGFVVFDATYSQGQINASRAVAPLDTPEFARGMAGDIRLLMFAPTTPLTEVGQTDLGYESCRWQRPDGRVTQVVLEAPERAHVLLYDKNEVLLRDGLLLGPKRDGFSTQMLLVAKGAAGYSLVLRLMESELESEAQSLDQTAPAD
jgi:hypothetical protein